MPGPDASDSNLGALVGALAAVVGLVGYVAFGWRFGDASGAVPQGVGVAVALFAVLVVLYGRLDRSG